MTTYNGAASCGCGVPPPRWLTTSWRSIKPPKRSLRKSRCCWRRRTAPMSIYTSTKTKLTTRRPTCSARPSNRTILSQGCILWTVSCGRISWRRCAILLWATRRGRWSTCTSVKSELTSLGPRLSLKCFQNCRCLRSLSWCIQIWTMSQCNSYVLKALKIARAWSTWTCVITTSMIRDLSHSSKPCRRIWVSSTSSWRTSSSTWVSPRCSPISSTNRTATSNS